MVQVNCKEGQPERSLLEAGDDQVQMSLGKSLDCTMLKSSCQLRIGRGSLEAGIGALSTFSKNGQLTASRQECWWILLNANGRAGGAMQQIGNEKQWCKGIEAGQGR